MKKVFYSFKVGLGLEDDVFDLICEAIDGNILDIVPIIFSTYFRLGFLL